MGSTYVERLEDTQRDLSLYFDKSAAVVRSNFYWFERQLARPAIAYSIASFDAHPFTTTFLAIFSFLSFLPIISFLGFSLFVIASITFVAFVLAFFIIAFVEVVLIIILLITLTLLLITALILTPLALSGYLTFRFMAHIRSDGRAGATQWATETKKRFVTPSEKVNGDETTDGSEVSAGSVVIIDPKEEGSPPSEAMKVEGD